MTISVGGEVATMKLAVMKEAVNVFLRVYARQEITCLEMRINEGLYKKNSTVLIQKK